MTPEKSRKSHCGRGLKKDVKAKNFILIGYEIEGEYHQLIFRKTKRIKVKKKIKSSKK